MRRELSTVDPSPIDSQGEDSSRLFVLSSIYDSIAVICYPGFPHIKIGPSGCEVPKA